MPKISEKKTVELEKMKQQIKTTVRQKQTPEDYLQFVKQQNQKLGKRKTSTEVSEQIQQRLNDFSAPRGLTNVASHANLGLNANNAAVFSDLSTKKKRRGN